MICHTICHASSNRHSMLCCAILCCNGYSMLCCDVLVLFSAAVHHVHEAVSRWRRGCLLFYADHFWKHCAGVCFQSGHHSSGHLVSDEDGKCQYQCILHTDSMTLLVSCITTSLCYAVCCHRIAGMCPMTPCASMTCLASGSYTL